jgi:TP901 family phage tail tape measure protein
VALSTRELYLVLRARDEASRVLRGLSRELLASGAAAEAAELRSAAAAARRHAEHLKATGASKAAVDAALRTARAYDAEAAAVINAARRQQHFVNTIGQTGAAIQTLGVGMTAAGLLSLAFFKNSIDIAVEYQRQVAHTHTQIDGFTASLQELSKMGLRVANEVGVAFEEIQPELFDIFSSTNANLKQAEILLNAFAKAAVAGQTNMQSATRATIAILNAFNIPLEDVNKVLDIQFELVRKGVGTYQEFADHLGNIIPSATRAGQSFEMVAAMLAFMTRNGLSAAMAATSGARALEAMSHPKTLERMEKMGIKVRDLKGNMLPLTDILQQLRDRIMKLPPTERVEALVDLLRGAGGTIQARRFLEQVLLRPGELEELKVHLQSMGDAAGVFETKYNEMSESVAVQSQTLRNRWMVLREEMGEALIPMFLKLISVIGNLLKAYNSLSDSQKRVVAIVLALTAVFITLSGVMLVVVGGFVLFASAIAAAGGTILAIVAVIFGVIGAIGVLIAALKVAYDHSAGLQQLFAGAVVRLRAIGEMFSIIGQKVREEWNASLLPALRTLGRVIEQHVMPALNQVQDMVNSNLTPKLREAGRVIGDQFATAMDFTAKIIQNVIVPAVRLFAEWVVSARQRLEPFMPVLSNVVKWMLIVAAVITGSVVAAIGVILVGAVMAAVGAFMLIVNAFIRTIQFIGLVIGWIRDLWNWTNNLGQSVAGLAGRFSAAFGSIASTIRNAVSNFGSLLVQAGRDLIDGLISGINAKLGPLRSALSAVGNFIRNNKGPRDYDLQLLRPAGQDIMAGLMQGIHDEFPSLLSQLQGVNNALTFETSGIGTAGFRPLGPPVTQPVTNNFYQTVNVTTQEIDPRVHSAQLGWELQSVMS